MSMYTLHVPSASIDVNISDLFILAVTTCIGILFHRWTVTNKFSSITIAASMCGGKLQVPLLVY